MDIRLIAGLTLLAWLPPALAGADILTHARFLIVLPVLLWNERRLARVMSVLPRRFLERELIPAEERPRFDAAASALRWPGPWASGGLLLLAYAASPWLRREPAGPWEAWVSVPLFQLAVWRWFLWLALWAWFNWRASRLKLKLDPAHPDLMGGLGFLTTGVDAYRPLLFCAGVLLAGRMLQGGGGAAESKIASSVLLAAAAVIVAPMLAYVRRLDQTKSAGRSRYGRLSSRYIHHFESKWMGEDRPGVDEGQLSEDIQGLDSIGGAYERVRSMRLMPVGRDVLLRLALTGAVPLAPALALASESNALKEIARMFAELFFGTTLGFLK